MNVIPAGKLGLVVYALHVYSGIRDRQANAEQHFNYR